MLTNSTLPDDFGRYYCLLTPRDTRPHTSLQAERFFSQTQALSFLHQLTVPYGYWLRIHQQASMGLHPIANENQLFERLSQMLYRGRIQAYRVEKTDSPATSGMAFSDENKVVYAIKPVSQLLTFNAEELRHFSDEHEALTFIEQSGIDDKQLDELTRDKNLPSRKGAAHAAACALVSGDLVVTVNRNSNAPPQPSDSDKSDETVVSDKPAHLAPPPVAAAATVAAAAHSTKAQAEDKVPPCITERVTIACKHGRTASITDKTEIVPILAVVATETKKSGLEQITAEIHGTALCDSHKTASFQISQEHKLKSREEKKVVFQANCGEWDVHNAFDRLWLPTVSPKTYRITPKQTCKTKDLKVSELRVDVYPKMKWLWQVDIDFGKLEFVPANQKLNIATTPSMGMSHSPMMANLMTPKRNMTNISENLWKVSRTYVTRSPKFWR